MRVLSAVLLTAVLAGCSNGTTTDVTSSASNSQTVTQQEVGRAFGMKIGESVALGDLHVTFRSVEGDSRCAIDVVCVWAGDAEIALRIEQGGKAAVAALHTTVDPRKTEWNGYTISLVSLAPSRRQAVPVDPGDYRAEILITR